MSGRRCGFTLVEVLVALGLFTLLGFGATAFLVMGLRTWRGAEARRDAAERAELVFAFLRDDLQCLYTDGGKAAGRAVLLSDYDKSGRQRLFLTRTVPPPAADPRIAGAGSTMTGRDAIDGVNDLANLQRGLLRGPGDLQSVAYVFLGDEKLGRVAATPEKEYKDLLGDWSTRGGQLLAEGVMLLELNFWSDRTTAWRAGAQAFEPSYFWDSTMGLAKEDAKPEDARERRVFGRTGSLEDGRDDIFPRLIEVRLVLGKPPTAATPLTAQDIATHETAIAVLNAEDLPREEGEYFVKLEREWISYTQCIGGALVGVARGRRGTQAADHEEGTYVREGVPFNMVVRPPCAHEPWRERKP
jgi:prepilin-type N-terminal cleavage/methylation domain-containing protein